MNALVLVREAAFNNASWCDATCREHANSAPSPTEGGVFDTHRWLNRGLVPPFTSNLITLQPGKRELQEQAIR